MMDKRVKTEKRKHETEIKQPKTILQAQNLTVYYDAVLALDNVSFTVNEGEIVVIIGPNGAGKSTALKTICGLLRPKSGHVLFKGESINGKQPRQLVKKGICLVPEGRRVFPSMTTLENIEMGAYTRKDNRMINESIDKVFKLFPELKERQKQKAGILSGGEQRMLAIGRALMLKPKLILFDEPSLGLSPNYVEAVFDKIKEINRDGIAILLVEQNVRMALEYADRAYIFEIGKIAVEDRAENLLRNDEVKKSFLGY